MRIGTPTTQPGHFRLSILNLRSEEPAAEPADRNALNETPPGLDAIRAWIRKPRPWLRSVRLWVRWILRGIRAAYRHVKKNWPATRERIRRIAAQGEEAARVVVRVGYAAREIGGGIVRSTRALRGPEGKVSGVTAGVRELGRAARGLGGRLTEGGTGIAAAFSSVGRLTRALGGNGQTGLGLLDPPEEQQPHTSRPPPAHQPVPVAPQRTAVVSPASGKTRSFPEGAARTPARSEAPTPSERHSGRSPVGSASGDEWAERLEGLPGVFIPRVKALGERPRQFVLRPLILDICSTREWTSATELAGWFSMHKRSLVKRHIGPMARAELLELRYPDRPNSPRQAYRTRGQGASDPTRASAQSPTSHR